MFLSSKDVSLHLQSVSHVLFYLVVCGEPQMQHSVGQTGKLNIRGLKCRNCLAFVADIES